MGEKINGKNMFIFIIFRCLKKKNFILVVYYIIECFIM